jgi:hypothetical protein
VLDEASYTETIENLRVRDVGFHSLTEALDTCSPIHERPQAGLAAARRAGRTGGRPPKLTDDDIDIAEVARPHQPDDLY